MAIDRPLVAHLLRRTSFGPFPGQVDAAATAASFDIAVAAVLNATPSPLPAAPDLTQKSRAPVAWWFSRMSDPGAGLAEKLTWFWHGHLTSSLAKVHDPGLIWRQHLLIREHALGSFRSLLQAITVDPAMLWYLDGAGSTAAAPNENYARELMELFALGRGRYTEADVIAGAYALSGWRLDKATGSARFAAPAGPRHPVTFLGRQVASAAQVIDAVCDQPSCAPWIAAKLYAFLAGSPPAPDDLDRLAGVFRSADLEIRPLVAAILADPAFPTARNNRPRYPVEWIVAAMAVMGLDNPTLAAGLASRMGQVPFRPPNVAGWPAGLGWLGPSAALARDALAARTPAIQQVAAARDPVVAAFERCSLYDVTDQTRTAIRTAVSSIQNAQRRGATALGLAIASPEFALA